MKTYRVSRFQRRPVGASDRTSSARPAGGSSSALWWALGIAGVAGVAGLAYAMSGPAPGPTAPTQPTTPTAPTGYKVLEACKGVEVTDEPAALKFARDAGTRASVYSSDAVVSWATEAAGTLGMSASFTCDPATLPPESLGFAYRVARQYIAGAAASSKMTKEQAEAALTFGRTQMLLQHGVPAERLPEGLPA